MKEDETFVFIDGPNIDGGCQKRGVWIDANELWNWLKQKWHIGSAGNVFFFVRETEEKEGFINVLKYIGYKVRGIKKRDVDPDLIVEMMEIGEKYPGCTIVLLSGDADYCAAIRSLRIKGHRTYALGFSESMSNELMNEADYWEHLDEVVLKIQRRREKIAEETGKTKIETETEQTKIETKPIRLKGNPS